MPVKAGSRRRTGAPLENARIAPATPTPAPRSALPEITAWMVSPAPCVPTASMTRLCFLKMPASWPSVGAWFSQLLIWPIAIFSVSCACAGTLATITANAAAHPSFLIASSLSFFPFSFGFRAFFCDCARPLPDFSSRMVQYSHVRVVTFAMALSAPAFSISPRCSGITGPSACAANWNSALRQE